MISQDIQMLEPGNIVTLYEVDLTPLGGPTFYYHGHNHEGNIIWQGKTYVPWAIRAEGFARKGSGAPPRPTLSIGNIGRDEFNNDVVGIIGALCLQFDDMVGVNVIRRRTFKKYLDEANFPEGNPTADPNEHWPDEVWKVQQKQMEQPASVDFNLNNPIDFNGRQLPNLQILATVCPWMLKGLYRNAPCNYTGSAMFDKDDNPVTDPTLDRCGGRVNSCKKRFAAEQGVSEDWAVINFGGFPAAGRLR